jgi:excinuclease UvrABC nuclease subunit
MKPPNQLLNIRADLCHVAKLDWRGGVYFLCASDSVVYVGQSRRAAARLQEHTEKDWNEAYFLPCESEARRKELEAAFISKLTPRYNIVRHSSGKEIFHHASLIGFERPDWVLGGLWSPRQEAA